MFSKIRDAFPKIRERAPPGPQRVSNSSRWEFSSRWGGCPERVLLAGRTSRAGGQASSIAVVFVAVVFVVGSGCRGDAARNEVETLRASGDQTVAAIAHKLRLVGLEPVDAASASVPEDERSKVLPCRSIPSSSAALDDHPGGYLIVGAHAENASDVSEIVKAIASWEPGTFLPLRVRRNPYLSDGSEWWEQDVLFYLPKP